MNAHFKYLHYLSRVVYIFCKSSKTVIRLRRHQLSSSQYSALNLTIDLAFLHFTLTDLWSDLDIGDDDFSNTCLKVNT